MDAMTEAARAIPAPTRTLRTAILAALVVGSLLICGAVGRATSNSGSAITHTTRVTGDGAVGGHPVFAHRYAGARADGTGLHQG
jgi:hypothetical protein